MSNQIVIRNGELAIPRGMSVSEIRQSIPRATDVEIGKAVAMLFTARKSAGRGDDDAMMTAEVYSLAISDYPAFAIEAAVREIIKGTAPNIQPVFVPSTDQLCSEIERHMWSRIKVADDQSSDEIAPTPKDRDAMKKRFEELQKNLRKMQIENQAGKR